MKKLYLALIGAMISWAGCGQKEDSESSFFSSKMGSEVVVYVAKFTPQTYEEGRELILKDLAAVMQNFDGEMESYLYESRTSFEVGGLQFFKRGAAVKQWTTNPEREAIVKKIAPLLREPLSVHQHRLVKTVISHRKEKSS